MSMGTILACEYKPRILKYWDPFRTPRVSFTWGGRVGVGVGGCYASLYVTSLTFSKSTQNLMEPSFLVTRTTGLTKLLWRDSIAAQASIFWTPTCSRSQAYGAVISVSIKCVTRFVHPISDGPLLNTCLYPWIATMMFVCFGFFSLTPLLLTLPSRVADAQGDPLGLCSCP